MKDVLKAQEFLSQTGRTLLTLRALLLKGEYKPGERLSELALVARLGVSRTPIRLSLDRLAQEGLVEPAASGGFTVKSFTWTDIADAIELRSVLEGTAARLAAERLVDTSELAQLHVLHRRMESARHHDIDSFAHYMDLNEQFHNELLRLAKSPMLERSLSHLTALPFAAPSAMVFAAVQLPASAERSVIGQEQHRAIIEAIELHQGARAEGIAREHALFARRNLEAMLHDENLLSRIPGAALIERTERAAVATV